ncbi:MAG: ribonuclease P protein component [Rhodospirillales bacterium]|nr:ribonuclease P protein component [Alphaproteobacteria bacterium]USO03913.1 MAG: ribonuclease P protein component [Rhodospirillales bacterium]
MEAKKENIKSLDRLKKRSDFLRARFQGQKWVAKGLILQVCENEGKGIRFGLTATRNLSKSAVNRNRIKRRLRSVAYDVLPLVARDHTDYVLIGRPQTGTRLYSDLKKDLEYCLRKTGVLKGD